MKIIYPTTEAIEEARNNPGGHVLLIDNKQGPFNDDSYIPPRAIIGAWKVDLKGIISGEFTHNPNHIPSSEGDVQTIVISRI